jgi:hypothetical protein
MLRALVEQFNGSGWEEIAKQMPDRSARQCRDRFKSYLVDSLVTKPWTPQEDAIVREQVSLIGPKWVEIGKLLNGRSGNNVKNRWHKHLSKGKPAIHKNDQNLVSRRDLTEAISPRDISNETAFEDRDWPLGFGAVDTSRELDRVWSSFFSAGDPFC